MELRPPELVVCTLPQPASAISINKEHSAARGEDAANAAAALRGKSPAGAMAFFSRIAFPSRTASTFG